MLCSKRRRALHSPTGLCTLLTSGTPESTALRSSFSPAGGVGVGVGVGVGACVRERESEGVLFCYSREICEKMSERRRHTR